MAPAHILSRRKFLRDAGAVIIGFAMPPTLLGSHLSAAGAAPGPGAAPDPGLIDSWLAIAGDGSVTVFTDKLELGMGVATAFAQIVAEELDVPVRSVSFIM